LSDVLAAYRLHASQSANVEIHIEPGRRILDRLFAEPELPRSIRACRSEAYAHFYAMLSGGSVKVGRYPLALYWGMRALVRDPRVAGYLAAFPARRLRRRRQPATMQKDLPLPAAVLDANAASAAASV
jgi:hypothetical protein